MSSVRHSFLSRIPLICVAALTAGCASRSERDAAIEERGYKRGYRQAVKEQYWIIQNLQRTARPARQNPDAP